MRVGEHSGSIWTKRTLAWEQSGKAESAGDHTLFWVGCYVHIPIFAAPLCVMRMYCTVVNCRLAISLAHVAILMSVILCNISLADKARSMLVSASKQ